MSAIVVCRTAALGGHVEGCDDCGATRIAYNSCRNRHCPKCQGLARAQWLAARQAELLPVPYFHVVFTLPAGRGHDRLPEQGCRLCHPVAHGSRDAAQRSPPIPGISAPSSASSPCCTPGARPYSIIPMSIASCPGGGPSLGRQALDQLSERLLPAGASAVAPLPTPVPRRAAQGLQCRQPRLLRRSRRACATPSSLQGQLDALRRLDWVVYAKPPFGGPEQVLAYLGRYTHRVAIANSRLVALDDGVGAASPGRIIATAATSRSWRSKPTSSSAASSSTRCRTVSIAFVTTASSPMALAPSVSPDVANCSTCQPPLSEPRAPTSMTVIASSPGATSLSVQTAAAPCGASPACHARPRRRFAATPHEPISHIRPGSTSRRGRSSGCHGPRCVPRALEALHQEQSWEHFTAQRRSAALNASGQLPCSHRAWPLSAVMHQRHQ